MTASKVGGERRVDMCVGSKRQEVQRFRLSQTFDLLSPASDLGISSEPPAHFSQAPVLRLGSRLRLPRISVASEIRFGTFESTEHIPAPIGNVLRLT